MKSLLKVGIINDTKSRRWKVSGELYIDLLTKFTHRLLAGHKGHVTVQGQHQLATASLVSQGD